MRDRRAEQLEDSAPAVVVLHAAGASVGACLREIDAGMEEEGVPFRMAESDLPTARELAHAAALASNLDVGIGVDAAGGICVQHTKLPLEAPALAGTADSARTLGHNAARLVSGIPFKTRLPRGRTMAAGAFGLAQARRVLDAALDKADQIGQPMNIAVVDGGGHLLAFARQDGAILGSIDIATRKARSAVLLRMSTADLGKAAAPDGPLYGIEVTNGGLVVFGGGIPLLGSDGQMVGGIGVSAGTVEQDVEVAEAGVAAMDGAGG